MRTGMRTRFTNANAARNYLQGLSWQDGPICAHCKTAGKGTVLKGKSTRPGVYWCNACRKPFSVTVGTVYEGSKVPLNIWLYANHLLCSKKGISRHQLAHRLGVTYKTAWFMARHIRAAMDAPLRSDASG
jgi:transposase-like protein